MASARDLITLFVALETISIPTFILAAFRKHDRRSNEAGVKYYLIGVLSSALMLYGMSLIFGVTGTTKLSGISAWVGEHGVAPLLSVAIFLSIIGFAFKVSAVPFHFWAPDTYEGAPDPGHRVPVGRVEGRRLRRADQHHLLRFLRRQRGRRALVVGRVWVLAALVDDARQPRRAAPDEHRAHAGVLVDRARRVHARALRGGRHRGRAGSPRRRRPGHERGRDLPLDLRRDEPRRLRGRDRGRAADAERRDLVVRGPVQHVARAGGDDDRCSWRRWPASRRSRAGSPSS